MYMYVICMYSCAHAYTHTHPHMPDHLKLIGEPRNVGFFGIHHH